MRSRALCLPVLMALTFASATAQTPSENPVDSGIVEQTEGRLMQIDVTARGPAEALAALTAKDFKLAVGREDIEEFVLDRVCIDAGVDGLDLERRPEVAAAAPRLRTMLFFDQTHLTGLGRQRSIELARELLPELLASGRSEAMIVSANRQLEVVSEWSSDPVALAAALDELLNDPDQRSDWADQEDARVDRMMAAIDRVTEFSQEQMRASNAEANENTQRSMNNISQGLFGGQGARSQMRADQNQSNQTQTEGTSAIESFKQMARVTARELSREEASRTSGGLSLFTAALSHLDDYAPPKAVLYFADTMRSNAGDFYIKLVQSADRVGKVGGGGGQRQQGAVTLSDGNYVQQFQTAIDFAAEKGVRFYTVQGRGLTPVVAPRARGGAMAATDPSAGRARFKDAENALAGFARETGGKSFLGAADASQIANQILGDLSCLFVLSFRPLELREDRPTSVWIEVEQPDIELKYRPKMISLSDEARDKARLASAFWNGNQSRDNARLVAVPTGFTGGKYTVLVQFAIPGSTIAGSDWDMGITAQVGKSRAIDASGRVAINQPGLPLVFEAEMRFPPGEFTITGVAESNEHGELISTKTKGTLLDPSGEDQPFVASVAMLQRTAGAFVRGEATKTAGSLAHGAKNWLNPERATGILALVCGNKRAKPVLASRSLAGDSAVSFDDVELDFSQERCGLLVDTIDGDVLTSGKFSYAVDLMRADAAVAASVQDFLVVSSDEIELARRDGE